MLFDTMNAMARNLVINGFSLIYDSTGNTRRAREDVLKLGKWVGARMIGVVMNTPISTCLTRDKDSNRLSNGRSVGEDVINKSAAKFETPTADEGFDEILILNTGTGMGAVE